MEPTPFECKKEFSQKYALSISDVQTIFNHPWSINLYKKLIEEKNRDPKFVYQWLYGFVNGNIMKKDLDFETIIHENFENEHKLGQLIDLV